MLKPSEITKSHIAGWSLLRQWEWPAARKTPETGIAQRFFATEKDIKRQRFDYIGIALDLSNKKKIVGGCSAETIKMCVENEHKDNHLCIPKEQINKEAVKCDSKYIEFCNIFFFFCFFVFVFVFVKHTHTHTHTHQHTRRRTTSLLRI